MTRIICDRCGRDVEKDTNKIQIVGITINTKDLCFSCIKQLEYFLNRPPEESN